MSDKLRDSLGSNFASKLKKIKEGFIARARQDGVTNKEAALKLTNKFINAIDTVLQPYEGKKEYDDDKIDQMEEDIREYLVEQFLEDKTKKPAPKEAKEGLRILLEKEVKAGTFSNVKYGDSKIYAATIMSEDFDSEELSFRGSIKADKINSLIGVVKTFEGFEYISENVQDIIEEYNESKSAPKSDASFITFDNLDDLFLLMFKNQNMQRLKNRKAAYSYWKDISEMIDDIVVKSRDLSDILSKLDKESDVFKKFRKVISTLIDIDEGGEDEDSKTTKPYEGGINYIENIPKISIQPENLDIRAYNYLLDIMKGIGYYMDVNDLDSLEEDVGIEKPKSEQLQREGASLPKPKQGEVKELYDDLEEAGEVDVLALLYWAALLKRNGPILKEEHDEFLEALRDNFEFMRIEDGGQIERAMESGIEQLELIQEYDGESHFPIYVKDSKFISDYFQEEVDTSEITSNIMDFMEAFSDVIFEDKKIDPKYYSDYFAGKGKTPLQEQLQTRTGSVQPQFHYSATVLRRDAKIRELDNKAVEKRDEIIKLIAEAFALVQNSPLLLGTDLPFSDISTIRNIIAFSKLDDRFLIINSLQNRYNKSGSAMFDIDDIERLTSLVKSLKSGGKYEEIKRKTEQAAGALINIYGRKEPKIREMIVNEMASYLKSIKSSLGESLGKEDKFSVGRDTVDLNEVKDAFNIEEVDDITKVKPLSNLFSFIKSKDITSLVEDIVIDSRDKEPTKKAIEELADVLKSEESKIHKDILSAHDTIRKMKGLPIHYAIKKLDNFDDVQDMMETLEKQKLDITATEINKIVNDLDSFSNISKAYGISSEQVYLIKSNFR